MGAGTRVEVASLNGQPGILIHGGLSVLVGAVFVEPSTDGRAALTRWVRNPSELTGISWTQR